MRVLLAIAGVLCCSCVYSQYYLIDEYNSTNFLDKVYFWTGEDPVTSNTKFVDNITATSEGLFNVSGNSIYIGVDSTNTLNENGRKSVRVHSNSNYTHGLFVFDFAHIPGNICGTWPIFWLIGWGRPWPESGEIHLIENINENIYNVISLHCVDECYITNSSRKFTGLLTTENCYVHEDYGNIGCQNRADRANTYGDEFNRAGGGVYVMEWSSSGFQFWHFTYDRIPDNIENGQPNPNEWGVLPLARFFGDCNFDNEFHDQNIIIATTFCGGWINQYWGNDCGSTGASSCEDFVRNNPTAFKETFWRINSIKIYSNLTLPKQTSTITSKTEPTTLKSTTSATQPTVFAKQTRKPSSTIYLAIFIPICLIITFGFALFCWCKLKQRQRLEAIYALAASGLKILNKDWIDKKSEEDLWKIPREGIIIQTEAKIGAGAFADVYVAKLIGNAAIRRVYPNSPGLSKFHDCEVAVKVLPQFSTEAARDDLQKEINFMRSLKFHQHLVCLLGYVSSTLSPLLILEYCAKGDLLHFLRAKKGQPNQDGLKIKDLISFSWQISSGLEYFTSLGLIHRDVAARNILLDKDNVCKIGDFGLCRTAENEIYRSRGGKLPVKWMSIESLKSFEYSMKTDVWSYGVLLSEVFTLGDAPYTGLGNADILPFLESGKRLQKPTYCPDEIYDLMLNCWRVNPIDRPVFSKICQQLKKMLEVFDSKYDYIDAIEPLPLISICESNSDESAI